MFFKKIKNVLTESPIKTNIKQRSDNYKKLEWSPPPPPPPKRILKEDVQIPKPAKQKKIFVNFFCEVNDLNFVGNVILDFYNEEIDLENIKKKIFEKLKKDIDNSYNIRVLKWTRIK